MTRVLVTGATGFVGRALCPVLRAAGHDVAAVVRRKDGHGLPDGTEPRLVPDIGPETDWDEALSGVGAVVHLAARVHVMKERGADPLKEYRRVNAEGTARLAAAAAAAGVGRFVCVSSVKVMGERSTGAPFDEFDQPAPEDAYGLSKWEGEKALLEVASQTGLEPVVLRAPLVYGPGVKGNFLALIRLCRWAPPLPFAAVDNRRSLIYVGNLAGALVRCLERQEAAGETYFVRDGEDLAIPDLIHRLAAALGRPARLFPAPVGLLRLAGRATGKSAAVARLLDDLQVDDRKIRRELGWKPAYDVVQGLNETAAWFVSENSPHEFHS